MENNSNGNDEKYSSLSIPPHSNIIEYFSQTGYFYLKTKATMQGKNPVYEKGNSFRIYAGRDGYSVLTITYVMQESNLPDPTKGKNISKAEFDKDY